MSASISKYSVTRAKKKYPRVFGPFHTVEDRRFRPDLLAQLVEDDDVSRDVEALGNQSGRVHNVWACVDLDDYWYAAYRLVSDDRGKPVIGEIRVYPGRQEWEIGEWVAAVMGFRSKVARGGLTGRVLRRITARSILEALQRMKQGPRASRFNAPSGKWLSAHWDGKAPSKSRQSLRGRPRRPEIDHAVLAAQYVALRKAQHPKPIPTLAKRRGETIPTVRAALHRARLLGLMPLGKKGAALAKLLPKAQSLLRRRRANWRKRR